MADKKTREEAREQLANMDPQELAKLFTKKVSKLQGEIEKKDALIAELSSQKSKVDQEAQQIIADAQAKAARIIEEAEAHRAKAKQIEEEAADDAAHKLSNARSEANSIVDTTLSGVRKDIAALEDQRETAKRDALAFMKNVAAEYDAIIESTSAQVSSYKDVRARLADQIISVESEQFRRFNLDDYVSTPSTPEPTVPSDLEDEDVDFDTLKMLLAEDDEEPNVSTPATPPTGASSFLDSFAFDVTEEDSDLVNAKESQQPAQQTDDFDDWEDFTFDDSPAGGATEQPQQQQSFTAAFMPPTADEPHFDTQFPVGNVNDSEFEDIEDWSDPAMQSSPQIPASSPTPPAAPEQEADDLGFEDIMGDLGNPSPLQIPSRPNFTSADQENQPKWL